MSNGTRLACMLLMNCGVHICISAHYRAPSQSVSRLSHVGTSHNPSVCQVWHSGSFRSIMTVQPMGGPEDVRCSSLLHVSFVQRPPPEWTQPSGSGCATRGAASAAASATDCVLVPPWLDILTDRVAPTASLFWGPSTSVRGVSKHVGGIVAAC